MEGGREKIKPKKEGTTLEREKAVIKVRILQKKEEIVGECERLLSYNELKEHKDIQIVIENIINPNTLEIINEERNSNNKCGNLFCSKDGNKSPKVSPMQINYEKRTVTPYNNKSCEPIFCSPNCEIIYEQQSIEISKNDPYQLLGMMNYNNILEINNPKLCKLISELGELVEGEWGIGKKYEGTKSKSEYKYKYKSQSKFMEEMRENPGQIRKLQERIQGEEKGIGAPANFPIKVISTRVKGVLGAVDIHMPTDAEEIKDNLGDKDTLQKNKLDEGQEDMGDEEYSQNSSEEEEISNILGEENKSIFQSLFPKLLMFLQNLKGSNTTQILNTLLQNELSSTPERQGPISEEEIERRNALLTWIQPNLQEAIKNSHPINTLNLLPDILLNNSIILINSLDFGQAIISLTNLEARIVGYLLIGIISGCLQASKLREWIYDYVKEFELDVHQIDSLITLFVY